MRRTVCVDVDDVLADYSKGWQGLHEIGDPIPGAVEFTRRLAEFADVLIYTTRCCEEMGRGTKAPLLRQIVQKWLDLHGFVYHEIFTGQGKPIFSAVVDDRAVPCRPREDASHFETALTRCKELCGVNT